MMSHLNLTALCAAAEYDLKVTEDDVYLSYLPLPHLMERMFLYIIVNGGGRICVFGGNVLKLRDDIQVNNLLPLE